MKRKEMKRSCLGCIDNKTRWKDDSSNQHQYTDTDPHQLVLTENKKARGEYKKKQSIRKPP
jgi:hypothetical protein